MIRPIYDAIDASIVDYYLNHGRNRDLEKFLRLRSRSSSNISDLSEDARLNEKKRLSKSKSLETLTKLPDKSVEEEPAIPEPQPNPKDVVTNPKELPRVETSNIKVKLKQNKKEKNNFNVESIIEINFPANPPQMLNSNLHQPEFKPISYSTDTQTQQNESTSMEITNIEDPIQPVLHTPKIKPSSPKYITQKSMSPSSTENKQKLEWDSLGDLG